MPKKLYKFCLKHCEGNQAMPFLQQMNGLRRNDDAMKTIAGIINLSFLNSFHE